MLSLFIRNIFDAKVRDYWQISKCTVNIIVRATQTVVAREAIIALCTGNKKTVRATRADNEKTSEKPPNPRRGTSLKKKLVKTISLKDKTYLKIEPN